MARDAAKEAEEKKAAEGEQEGGSGGGPVNELTAPRAVEERLGALEEKMTNIQDTLKELLLRLPPKRR